MPTFDTPEPITATIDVVVGDVRISASDRGDHRRRGAPERRVQRRGRQGRRADPRRVRGRRAAGQGAEAALLARRSGGGSVDVTIELPAGSHVHGAGQLADFRCDGRARRLPDQDRPRSHPARRRRHAEPEERHRRHQRRPRDGPRRGHDRVRRRARRASSTAAP